MRYSPWIGIKYFGFIKRSINFCSSCPPCPEVWISFRAPWITSAPARNSISIVLLTLTVFPGIGEDENTTVSPGIIWIWRWVPFAILDSAAIGSPWLPVHKIVTRLAGIRLIWEGSMNVSFGHEIYPSCWPISIAASILRPNTATLRLCNTAASTTCCKRWIFEANVAKIIRPSTLRKMSWMLSPTRRSDIVKLGISLFVLSESKHRTPSLPISAIFVKLAGSPTGVKSNLKSPVCTICPFGVFTTIP